MRPVSQANSVISNEMSGMLFALEAVILSVAGGLATVKPTARRIFPDNDAAFEYEPIEDVRLLTLVWGGGKSGVSGNVSAGDECLLIAISHGDAEEPDHKNLSACCAFAGFSNVSAFPMPDSVGLRIFHESANVTMQGENITVDNGGGAKLVFDGGGITMTAPDGCTINGNTQVNGNLGVAGDMTTSEGSGGSGRASFAGDIQVNGTSAAVDHNSGGISGIGHTHKENGDGGGETDPPQ